MIALGFGLQTGAVVAQVEDEPEEVAVVPRADAVPADEPEGTAEGRLTALTIAAAARLMTFQEGVQQRVERGAQGVYRGLIVGEIELGIAHYTRRVVSAAEEDNAAVLVFEIETPGGRVDAAILMRDVILESEIPTVAYINHRAWSAGALISLGHQLIVVSPGSSVGAATPITMGGGGMQPVEEKVVSALRSEFRAAAEAHGRSTAVAEAMVDADLAVGGVIPSGRLLTLTGNEALNVGFAETEASDFDDLLALLGLEGVEVTTIEQSWSESIVRVLTSPAVSGILMSLGMLGLFFELSSPGFGWAGGIGISALAIFFAGHLLVHLAGFEEVALFGVGVVLLAVEIFAIPGFGLVGLGGVIAIASALTMALVNTDINIDLRPISLSGALMRVSISLVSTVAAAIIVFKFLPRSAIGKRLVLQESLAAGGSIRDRAEDRIGAGETGVALTGLRPFGKARIGKTRVEVVAEGPFIEKGAAIRVVQASATRIEVRRATNPNAADSTAAPTEAES